MAAESAALARQRRVGHPFEQSSQQGALISKAHLDKVLGYVQSAQDAGAELLCGGTRVGDQGYYMEPTVFAGCTDDMKVFKDEVNHPLPVTEPLGATCQPCCCLSPQVFGPVMTLAKFTDIEEVRRASEQQGWHSRSHRTTLR